MVTTDNVHYVICINPDTYAGACPQARFAPPREGPEPQFGNAPGPPRCMILHHTDGLGSRHASLSRSGGGVATGGYMSSLGSGGVLRRSLHVW